MLVIKAFEVNLSLVNTIKYSMHISEIIWYSFQWINYLVVTSTNRTITFRLFTKYMMYFIWCYEYMRRKEKKRKRLGKNPQLFILILLLRTALHLFLNYFLTVSKLFLLIFAFLVCSSFTFLNPSQFYLLYVNNLLLVILICIY